MSDPRGFGATATSGGPAVHEVLHWTIKDKAARTILIQILAIILFIPLGLLFLWFARTIGKPPDVQLFGLLEIVICVVSIVATFVLHELAHGLTMRLCGARPTYGVLWKQVMFYATSPGHRFPRDAWLLTTLAPLAALSALALLGMLLLQGTRWIALLAICGAINAGGSVGDMWLAGIVLRYPKTAYVVDERDGIRVFLPRA